MNQDNKNNVQINKGSVQKSTNGAVNGTGVSHNNYQKAPASNNNMRKNSLLANRKLATINKMANNKGSSNGTNGNAPKKNNGRRGGLLGKASKSLSDSSNVGDTSSNNKEENTTNNSPTNSADTGNQSEIGSVDDEVNKATAKVKKKLLRIVSILAVKIVIIIAIFFILLLLFICVLCAPLFMTGIVDIGEVTEVFTEALSGVIRDTSNPSVAGYVATTTSNDYWWPIGSDETTDVNGITYALGVPIATKITSYFGVRDDPMEDGATSGHNAIDIAPYDSSIGTGVVNIIATKDGVVTYSGINSNCGESTKYTGDHDCGGKLGNYVEIRNSDGITVKYGHMYAGSITVNKGDNVKQGQVIGKMGSSGNSTGRHLHFALFNGGTPIDPLEYVSKDNPRP